MASDNDHDYKGNIDGKYYIIQRFGDGDELKKMVFLVAESHSDIRPYPLLVIKVYTLDE
jgi:hypothetical protein